MASLSLQRPFFLRLRLLRRISYRIWKSAAIRKGKSLLSEVRYEGAEMAVPTVPAIILATFRRMEDFLVLSYLFREKELALFSPTEPPRHPAVETLKATQHILYFDSQAAGGYRFFHAVMQTLRDFNRSLVIAPDAARAVAGSLTVEPALVARLAMLANVPIVPVRLTWQEGAKAAARCSVWIGNKVFISPRAAMFKDIFFKRRGARKFNRLPKEDLTEIGGRIFKLIGC
jgi:hypothetical protein